MVRGDEVVLTGEPVVHDRRAQQDVVNCAALPADCAPDQPDREEGAEDGAGQRADGPEPAVLPGDDPETHDVVGAYELPADVRVGGWWFAAFDSWWYSNTDSLVRVPSDTLRVATG